MTDILPAKTVIYAGTGQVVQGILHTGDRCFVSLLEAVSLFTAAACGIWIAGQMAPLGSFAKKT